MPLSSWVSEWTFINFRRTPESRRGYSVVIIVEAEYWWYQSLTRWLYQGRRVITEQVSDPSLVLCARCPTPLTYNPIFQLNFVNMYPLRPKLIQRVIKNAPSSTFICQILICIELCQGCKISYACILVISASSTLYQRYTCFGLNIS